MPELPEVEVTCRGVAPRLEGACIQNVRCGLPLRWPLGCEASFLVGLDISKVYRRGKYLVLQLSVGYLLIHLGMSGRLLICDEDTVPSKHDHFEIQTSRSCVRLRDPRRFGAVIYAKDLQEGLAGRLFSRLGVEPLDEGFSVNLLVEACRKTNQSIKQLLLSSRVVAGLGNIYACEALYLSGILPSAPAAEISTQRLVRLHEAIRRVLSEAIALGGSTLRDYAHVDGSSGAFQLVAKVYGRGGKLCLTCNEPIVKTVVGQRSTYFCPRCQT